MVTLCRSDSIVVSGEDVYVAGYVYNGSYYVAKYWKNGKAVPLSDGMGPSIAYAITLSGNDVYVAGYEATGQRPLQNIGKMGSMFHSPMEQKMR